jgi:hypothetical protein
VNTGYLGRVRHPLARERDAAHRTFRGRRERYRLAARFADAIGEVGWPVGQDANARG